MGLFSNNKKLCPICGNATPRLLARKVEGVPICGDCDAKIDMRKDKQNALTLQELERRQIPMVIATSSDRSYLQAAFQRNGIDSFFQKIFTCGEVGAGKSSPRIYLQAADYLQLPPQDIWVFEDALYAVETAKKAGFKVLAVYDESSQEQEEEIRRQSDLFLKDFTEKIL